MYVCMYASIYIYIYISSGTGFDSRVFNNQNDETLSQNSLRYLRKVNLPIALS